MNIDDGAEIMIPARTIGGIIVLGESMIAYFSSKQTHVTAPVQETTFKVCAKLHCTKQIFQRFLQRSKQDWTFVVTFVWFLPRHMAA